MPDLCAFCGIRAGDTSGHAPGRLFFPQPRPDDLITVPACAQCNNGASKDEEFFRATYLFSNAGTTATGQRLWDQKQHSAYRKNQGLRAAIARKLHPVDVFNSYDLWLGKRTAIELDHNRLSRVVASIIRGLFYFETATVIEPDVRVEAAPLLTDAAIAQVKELSKDTRPGKRDWPGTFQYRCGISNDVRQGSIWFVRFFGHVCYWGLTIPRDMMDPEADQPSLRTA